MSDHIGRQDANRGRGLLKFWMGFDTVQHIVGFQQSGGVAIQLPDKWTLAVIVDILHLPSHYY